MRLLNVIRSVDPVRGGPAEGLRQSVVATRALGHCEEVLTLDAPGDAWLRDFPAPLHALGPVASTYGRSAALLPWLRAHRERYDAVIVHGLWQYPGLAVRRALHGGSVPYFVYPHGMLDPWFRQRYPIKHAKKLLYWAAAERAVLRDAAALLCTTDEEARLAPATFPGYRATTAVVGYGVALGEAAARADAALFHAVWPDTRGKRIVLFLGRLHPKKGGDLLVEAFAQAARGVPELHLVMAGPDGEGVRAQWQALAARLGVAERITWTGMLAGEAKWSAFKAAEVFALPSHQENFGMAVAEALAMGLPVLISDKVNIWREIVAAGAGHAGPDTLAGTVDGLARWLAHDEPARRRMRERASACFRSHFHITSAAQRLIDVVAAHVRNPQGSGLPAAAIHGHATFGD
ncbi:MAG TPA: glycosyltransferase [Methylibium sp.]|nr:glycosyltransferase [Methylibium sp.]